MILGRGRLDGSARHGGHNHAHSIRSVECPYLGKRSSDTNLSGGRLMVCCRTCHRPCSQSLDSWLACGGHALISKWHLSLCIDAHSDTGGIGAIQQAPLSVPEPAWQTCPCSTRSSSDPWKPRKDPSARRSGSPRLAHFRLCWRPRTPTGLHSLPSKRGGTSCAASAPCCARASRSDSRRHHCRAGRVPGGPCSPLASGAPAWERAAPQFRGSDSPRPRVPLSSP